MRHFLLLTLLLTLMLMGCGADIDPCLYEVGDTFEVTVDVTGILDTLYLTIDECDLTFRLHGDSVVVEAGQILFVEIILVVNASTYEVVRVV